MGFIKKYHKRILIVAILGVLLHFTFGFFGESPIVGCFSAVNESVWEHLKLLFFPMLLITLYEKLFGKEQTMYLNWVTTLIGMGTILMAHYTYVGILGQSIFIVDFCIYIAAVLLSFFIKSVGDTPAEKEKLGGIGFLLGTAIFILFTFMPPRLPVFMDPITMLYGI